MAYLGLTTTEQILAILTVDDEDITAEKIEAQGLDDDLMVALSAGLPTWEVVRDNVEKPGNQARLRLFAKYFCAGTVAKMAQVFVKKKTTDGSNEGQRSDKDGWAFMSAELLAKAGEHLVAITDDLGTTPALKLYSVIGRVIPERDPITEPRSST